MAFLLGAAGAGGSAGAGGAAAGATPLIAGDAGAGAAISASGAGAASAGTTGAGVMASGAGGTTGGLLQSLFAPSTSGGSSPWMNMLQSQMGQSHGFGDKSAGWGADISQAVGAGQSKLAQMMQQTNKPMDWSFLFQ